MGITSAARARPDKNAQWASARSSPRGADVLVVEDRLSLRTMLRRTLESKGYSVEEAGDAVEARGCLSSSRISVVLTDLRLPRGSGMDVLRAAREADTNLPVIVMTAYGTIEDAVVAMKEGAFDFLAKPVDTDHLLVLMERAVDRRRLLIENLILKEEYASRYGFPRIVGEGPALAEVSSPFEKVVFGRDISLKTHSMTM